MISAHNNWIRQSFTAILVAMGCFAFAGCNTIEGAGEDIEAAGDSIQDSASDD